jgi:glycosyltransferase involved in cell wall biosynthesis
VGLNKRGGVYTGADCYVFPLRAEGFAMTILEAMACGLPVIATPWSGLADYLSPRYNYTLQHSRPLPERAQDGTVRRFHVEPNVDHLVHLMRHVYANRDEAKAMGADASAVARSEWTWEHAAAKLARVLGLPAQRGPREVRA